MCNHSRNSQNSSQQTGFMMVDILVSVAILAFLIVPMTVFIIKKQNINTYINEIRDKLDLTLFASDEQNIKFKKEVIGTDNIFAFDGQNYSSTKTCDLFMNRIIHNANSAVIDSNQGGSGSIVVSDFPSKDTLYEYIKNNLQRHSYNILEHERNIPTSIEIIESQNNVGIFIGTNSGSTTDPDLYVYTLDKQSSSTLVDQVNNGISVFSANILQIQDATSSANIFPKLRQVDIGPGIVDMLRVNTSLYVAERSTVRPLSRIDIGQSGSNAINYSNIYWNQLLIFDFPPDIIDKTFPKSIDIFKNTLFIGTEKNLKSELFGVSLGSTGERASPLLQSPPQSQPQSISKLFDIEINSGVNDIAIYKNYLAVTSPKNPEVELYSIKDLLQSSSTVSQYTHEPDLVLDLDGSSGNGKSLYSDFLSLSIGRTVGNSEVVISNLKKYLPTRDLSQSTTATKNQKNELSIISTMNPNRSITHIQSLLGGKYMFLFSNNIDAGLAIYEKKPQNNTYVLVGEFSTFAPIADFDCTSDRLFLLEQSTTTALTTFYF